MSDAGAPESVRPGKPASRSRRIWAGLLTALAVPAALTAVAATAVRYVPFLDAPLPGDQWAIVTAFSDFGVIAYAVAIVLVGLGLIIRFGIARLVLTIVVLVAAVVQLSWIVPRFVGGERPPVGDVRVRVLTQNLHFGQASTADLLAHGRGADIMVLTELTRPALQTLLTDKITSEFPYQQTGVLTNGPGGGTRVFSRYPITSTRWVGGDLRLWDWLVGVDVPDLGTVEVLAVHPGRPHRNGLVWVAEQESVRRAAPSGGRVMIVGDFNATDSQIPLRTLRAEGFRSATDLSGAGWQPTYPSNSRIPPLVEIDHVLLSPGLTATSATTLHTANTDHRGLLVTVAPA